MPRSRPPYPPEFRCQMVELVRAGRNPEELAREFNPSSQTIRNWAAQAHPAEDPIPGFVERDFGNCSSTAVPDAVLPPPSMESCVALRFASQRSRDRQHNLDRALRINVAANDQPQTGASNALYYILFMIWKIYKALRHHAHFFVS